MNERLKQFADQCRGDPMTSAFEPRFDKEKFAELIVKEMVDECAKVCVQHAGWTPDMIAKQVKQHFGVES